MMQCSQLQVGQCGLVVRLFTDLRYLLGMDDSPFLIDHDHGPGKETGKGSVDDPHAIVVAEGPVSEFREHGDIIEPLRTAEAGQGKREVGGNTQDPGSREFRRLRVEFAHRHGADFGVDAGEDIQDRFAALEVCEALFGKSLVS